MIFSIHVLIHTIYHNINRLENLKNDHGIIVIISDTF